MEDGRLYHGFYPVSLALLHNADYNLQGDGKREKNSGGIFTAYRCRVYTMRDAKSALPECWRLRQRLHRQFAPGDRLL